MNRERNDIPNDSRAEWTLPKREPGTEGSYETDSPLTAATDADTAPAKAHTTYLPNDISADADGRWQRIQGEFVDDPRRSVTEAHQLVSELMQRVIAVFSEERDGLERQWSGGEDVSTEDLRICMQRYRSFFSRLLPLRDRTDVH